MNMFAEMFLQLLLDGFLYIGIPSILIAAAAYRYFTRAERS